MLNTQDGRIPRVGLGLDYQYYGRYPGGLDGLFNRYRERLSHLSIVAVPDVVGARHIQALAGTHPIIHHLTGVAPANPTGADLRQLAALDELSRIFGAKWAGEDLGIWSFGPYNLPYFIPPLFEAEVADRVCDEIFRVQERSSVPFLAEVPSCQFVAGRLSLGEFFQRVVARTRCPVVLDLSHVFSYGLVTSTPPGEVLRSLPLEKVWEVHVAGGSINKNHPFRYIDSHSTAIMEPVMELLRDAVALCPELKAVTYEIGMKLPAETIEADLGRLDALLGTAGFVPRIGTDSSPSVLSA